MGVWLLLGVLLWAGTASAERTVAADKPFHLRLEPNQPSALVLPEKVASVHNGWDKDTLVVSNNGPFLFLQTPFADLAGRLLIVGESGALYRGTFKVQAPADDVLYLVREVVAKAEGVPFSADAFLVALWTRSAIPGEKAMDLPMPHLPDTRIALGAVTSRQAQGLVGMTLTLRNTQDTPLALDVRLGKPVPTTGAVAWTQAVWPPHYEVLLITSEQEVVAPGAETRVHVVLERRGK